MIHPLATWLTGRQPRHNRRAAVIGLVAALGALAGSAYAFLQMRYAVLDALLWFGLLTLLLLPAGTASLAGLITALERRGEHFQFLLMTTLPERLLVRGVLAAAVHRTRWLRAVAVGALPPFVLGGMMFAFRQLVQLNMYMSSGYGTGVIPMPDPFLPAFMFLGIGLVLWWLNFPAARLGVGLAVRWGHPAVVVAAAPVIALGMLLSPLLILMSGAALPLMCLAGPFLLLWMAQFVFTDQVFGDVRRALRGE